MEAAENTITDLAREFALERLNSNEKFELVKAAVNYLIVHDFSRLVQLLYRIDVPEAKLKKALQEQAGTDAADIVTRMLIERQIQKIKSREESDAVSEAIPDDERW